MNKKKHERVSTSKASKLVGCSHPTLYRAFEDVPPEESASAFVKGAEVVRHQATVVDGVNGNAKWVWDVTVYEHDEHDPAPVESEPPPSEPRTAIHSEDPDPTIKKEFKELPWSLKGWFVSGSKLFGAETINKQQEG